MKDPSQFRERFKKWKEGTPIEEIYDNGRPTEYIEYMKRLAQPMAKNWEISEKEAYVHLLNDDSYDYYGWWKDGGKNIDPKTMEAAKPPLLPNDDGHFPDTYKTAKHPTFSNQSKYSGVVHPKYNPLGIHGGTWLGDTYLKGPMYLPGYSGGKNDNELPEVVVTPTKNTTAQVNQMRKIIPNNTLRNQFYDYLVEHTDNISSNDALNRFMKIYNWVDNPKIKLMNRYSDGSWESTNKYGTSNPDYFMHTISLGDDRTRDEYMNRSDLLAELSHAYQMMSKNANRLGLKPPFKSIVEQIRSRDDVDKYGRSGYDRIGNIEYNAHSIIEPVMIDYNGSFYDLKQLCIKE